MSTELVIASACLILGIVSLPAYIRIAKSKKIIDVRNQRSSHSIPTARGGGIFIPIGLMGFLTVTFFVDA